MTRVSPFLKALRRSTKCWSVIDRATCGRPRLDSTEALQLEAQHFVDCIENNKKPETDGTDGLRLVRIVEAAEKSLRARGQLVEIEQ